jgi:CubicO group peptidase (beta-lactamase class C family)
MSSLAGEWKGIATLRSDGFGTAPSRDYRFILEIREDAEGRPSGSADAPDLGVMRMPLEDVRFEGDALSCGISAIGARLHARVRADGQVLDATLEFGSGARVPLPLRRDPADFLRFDLPRLTPSGEPALHYDYAPPERTDDGWETASLDESGIDAAKIGELMAAILAGDFGRQESVLVARRGRLVLEEYFHGQRREQTHTFQSCTKSITSLVMGTAVDRGLVDLDAPVYEFFPERSDTKWVRDKYPVTVRHALTMSGALEWDETLPYVDPRNDNRAMNASGDWIGYVLDRDLAGTPGEAYMYCSGLTTLLGGIVKQATGRYVDELAAEHLFGPLGIERFGWGAAADGTRHTGGGLHLLPRDMAKLGQLVLDLGTWQGKRVLSEAWLRDSTARHLLAETPYPIDCEFAYGYQWWLPSYRVDGRRVDSISARGYGGQCLCVMPALSLVIVLNAGDYEGDRTRLERTIGDYILPAVAP